MIPKKLNSEIALNEINEFISKEKYLQKFNTHNELRDSFFGWGKEIKY